MSQQKSSWRPSLRRMFSSKEAAPQVVEQNTIPNRSASNSSSSSTDSSRSTPIYTPKHAACDFVSMVPSRDQSDPVATLPNSYAPKTHRIGNCAGTTEGVRPLYLGHRDTMDDFQAFIAREDNRSTRSKPYVPRKVGLPRTNKVMDEITAKHHARQAGLYGKVVDYIKPVQA